MADSLKPGQPMPVQFVLLVKITHFVPYVEEGDVKMKLVTEEYRVKNISLPYPEFLRFVLAPEGRAFRDFKIDRIVSIEGETSQIAEVTLH